MPRWVSIRTKYTINPACFCCANWLKSKLISLLFTGNDSVKTTCPAVLNTTTRSMWSSAVIVALPFVGLG